MQSMTGYGRGIAERDGRRVVVELRSVNHRFLDIKVRGGALGAEAMDRVDKLVKSRLARGAIAMAVRVVRPAAQAGVRIDLAAARRTAAELTRLSSLGVTGTTDAALLLAQPGVVSIAADEPSDDAELAELAGQAAARALDALASMRAAEGEALAADIAGRLDHLAALANALREEAANAPAAVQQRLHERLTRLLDSVGATLDRDRLAQEVAILADRADVTEELVRIASHLEQARAMLTESQPVGRKLEFLVQELGREFNTIGSKSQSASIAAAVVEAKAELEKIREQVQNVE